MDARLAAESAANAGTAATDDGAATESTKPHDRWDAIDPGDSSGAIILIADDNPRNVDILVRLLSVRGYEAAVASSGERALELARRLQPDLILLDVEMPGMSGFNVCRILSAQPDTQHIPVIFVTGHTGTVAAALDAGAVDFIAKPVQAAELYARVGTRLRMETLRRELRAANDALLSANATLEDRVAQRTAQLETANGELRREIEARQIIAERLTYLSEHDPLTRLLNRRTFADSSVSMLTSDDTGAVYLRVELDRMDLILTRHGESTGETALAALSAAVRSCVGPAWVAGRADDRAIGLLRTGDPGDIDAPALASAIIARFDARMDKSLTGMDCRAVIGIVETQSLDANLHDMDAAAARVVEQAREAGTSVLRSTDEMVHSKNSALWVDRMITAMENDHFVLFGQPLRGLGARRGGESYELLIRWRDPATGDVIAPGMFLPVAERHRMMPQVDRWAVNKAIEMLNTNVVPANARAGVNLSGQSLTEHDFAGWLLDAVSRLERPGSNLIFEVTEQSAVRHVDQVHDLFGRLHKLGHRLALDDFGTDYASYSYLKQMPVDSLKIDRSFVSEMVNEPISGELVRSMNELGHALGLTTIAEGVETAEVLRAIEAMGVDFAQGWHIGRPKDLSANDSATPPVNPT